MFLINGALAVFNGLIVQSKKFWCECVVGGVCCGGECHCDEGDCCGDTWHPDDNPDAPCPEGWTFLRWGENESCCGCLPPAAFDPEQNGGIAAENVAASLCCPMAPDINGVPLVDVLDMFPDEWGECPQRCCDELNGVCVHQRPFSCGASSLPGLCSLGCPVPCCDPDGEFCEIHDQSACPSHLVRGASSSCDEAACVGACCVYGEDGTYAPHESSPTTKANCDSVGGEFQGVGTTVCLSCDGDAVPQNRRCRKPFDDCCCEEKASKGAGLTFYQPRDKRMPPLNDTPQATVQFTTSSPILIHGELFGATGPYEQCVTTLVIPLCWDAFNVEPVPCGSNFKDLKIKVCWDQFAIDAETFKFSGCNNITVWLGNCEYECETVMSYEGGGHTSNVSIEMRGDGTILADGTGPLVLTNSIKQFGNCDRTLTLAGSSDQLNEVRSILDPAGPSVCHVVKDGLGRWRFNASSRGFLGDLTVKLGTLQVGNAGSLGGSSVRVGGDSGAAALLLEENVTISIDVIALSGTQGVLFGGMHNSGVSVSSGLLRMGRDVTLVAKTGGTFEIQGAWADANANDPADKNVIIGAAGYAGKVLLNTTGTLETTGSVLVAYGTVEIGQLTTLVAGGGLTLETGITMRVTGSGCISESTVVTAQSATLTVESYPGNPAVSQSLDDLIVTGTLTLNGSDSLTVADLSGSGGIVNAAGTLTLNANSMTGSLSITGGTVVVNDPTTNPGGLAVSATFTSSTLTVVFSGDPTTGDEYVLLAGPTANSYGTVTLTGTTKTGTYNSATSTLTIS